jgi:hypothetical protein
MARRINAGPRFRLPASQRDGSLFGKGRIDWQPSRHIPTAMARHLHSGIGVQNAWMAGVLKITRVIRGRPNDPKMKLSRSVNP